MPRYVFSFISFFDNDLVSEILEANSRLEALETGFRKKEFEIYEEDVYGDETDEEKKIALLKQEAFNNDSMIDAICID